MIVKSIYSYPVKSLAGIAFETTNVEKRGFENDRRFMFIDRNNNFVTARTHHKLGGISVHFNNGELIFKNRFNHTRIKQKVKFLPGKISATIWRSKSTCNLIENNVIDDWISDFVREPIRLVYMADDDIRNVNPKYGKPGEIVSFADGYPLLITNTRSLEELNRRLAQPVEMTRFRPNLVVDAESAWEEDHWKKIKIGDVMIRMIKPCARCVVTTINPKTGEMGIEPLHTLSLFRKENNKVLFGINAIAEQFGVINVGDKVELF